MKRYMSIVGLIAGLTFLFSLSGCGGGSAVSGPSENGSIRISVKFPEVTRVIPVNTQGVKLVLSQNNVPKANALITRNQNNSQHQFSALPAGTYL